ncbi:MAG: GNAT family N-acetyltransferase [Pseudomonadota bacterium]
MIEKWRQPFIDFGLRTGLLYVCQRILARIPLSPVPVKYFLVAQPVPPPPRKIRPHSLRIEQIDADDYQIDWFPRPAPFIAARYEQNAKCFVAFSDDHPLACLWLKTAGDYTEDTVRCRFRPEPQAHTAWDFDVYVQPEHRLGRTFMHLWNHAFEWMRERDIHWTMSRIDAFNLPSINAHKRLGAQFTGSVVFWTWGRWQLALASQTPRFSLSRQAMPIYTVSAPERTD